MDPDVEVTIGDQTYEIEGRRSDPLVFNLSPGSHRLSMRRGDRMLFVESFEVRPGENVVRTAWCPDHLVEEPGRSRSSSRRGQNP